MQLISLNITQGDLGSPLTKIIHNAKADENVILGVMIKPHIQENYTLHRFIRSSFIIDDVKEMVKALESKTENDEA